MLVEHGVQNEETLPIHGRDDLLDMFNELERVTEEEKDALYAKFNEIREDPNVLSARCIRAEEIRNGDVRDKENTIPTPKVSRSI